MGISSSPLIKNAYWKGVSKTASYVIQGQDIQTVFNNLNSSGTITLTLPKAAPGLYYKFLVAAAHTITVTPKVTTDTIRGKAAGASASNGTVGNFLSLICSTPGYWEPEINIGGW